MAYPSALADPGTEVSSRTHDLIATRGLRVTFVSKKQTVEALRGIDLAIPKGALFALLGPNGAGKTTLMRCITGLARPTGGSLEVLGEAVDPEGPGAAAARARLARMGILIENPGVYGRLDAREYLSFFASFYRISDAAARIRELCGELGLELDAKPVAKLSQGNRQKLQLARSLLHSPDLLLWDEPTDHLDPASQRDVLAYLRSYLAASGATALVATHRLEQMENVGSHFGFLSQGRLLAAGPRERILGGPEADGARLGFARPVAPEDLAWLASAFSARLEPADAPHAYDMSGPDLRERMPAIIRAAVERGLPLASAEPRRASLSDVYQRWVGG
jgi:ABC-2 type transport system ATP-binding protein